MWAKYFKPFLEERILPILLRAVLKFLYYTNRHVWNISPEIKDEPAVYVFWHGEMVMQCFMVAKFVHKGPVSMLNSHHKDGALMVNAMKHFKLETIRGSSRHGAVKALIDSVKYAQNGGSMGLTIDGPKGPRHTVSNGAVVISQKADIPIIPLHVIPTKYWRLKTWDQLIIPKPFGTLTFIMEAPFKLTGLSLEDAKAKIKTELMKNSM